MLTKLPIQLPDLFFKTLNCQSHDRYFALHWEPKLNKLIREDGQVLAFCPEEWAFFALFLEYNIEELDLNAYEVWLVHDTETKDSYFADEKTALDLLHTQVLPENYDESRRYQKGSVA